MKPNETQKILANTLLLVFIMAVVMLPAVSSGIMKVNKDDRVLSVTDERPQAPTKPTTKPVNRNVKTIIIKEIPETKPTEKPQVELRDYPDSAETTESTASEEI